MPFIDRTGQVYGDFTVIRRLDNYKGKDGHCYSRWLLKCNLCGVEVQKYSSGINTVNKCKCRKGKTYGEPEVLCRYNSGVLCKEQDKCDTCGWYKQYLREQIETLHNKAI